MRSHYLLIPTLALLLPGCSAPASAPTVDARPFVNVDGGMPTNKTDTPALMGQYLAAVQDDQTRPAVMTVDPSAGVLSLTLGSALSQTPLTTTAPAPIPSTGVSLPPTLARLALGTTQYAALFSWSSSASAPLYFLAVGAANPNTSIHGEVDPAVLPGAPLAVSPDGTQVAFESCASTPCEVERATLSATPSEVPVIADPTSTSSFFDFEVWYGFLGDGTLALIKPDGTAGTVDAGGAFTPFAGVDPVTLGQELVMGNELVLGTSAGKIVAVSSTGTVTTLVQSVVSAGNFVADGNNLIYDDNQTLYQVPLAGGTSNVIGSEGEIWAVSPSGRYVTVGFVSDTMAVLDLKTNPPTLVAGDPSCFWRGFTFSPDDKRAIFEEDCPANTWKTRTWTSLDLASGATQALQSGDSALTLNVSFAPVFVEPGLVIVPTGDGTTAYLDDLVDGRGSVFDTGVQSLFAVPSQPDTVVYQTGDAASAASHVYWATVR
jgi:hypothetical protein